jgi:hypothetical protein
MAHQEHPPFSQILLWENCLLYIRQKPRTLDLNIGKAHKVRQTHSIQGPGHDQGTLSVLETDKTTISRVKYLGRLWISSHCQTAIPQLEKEDWTGKAQTQRIQA